MYTNCRESRRVRETDPGGVRFLLTTSYLAIKIRHADVHESVLLSQMDFEKVFERPFAVAVVTGP
jgi:hypothetical protein